MANQWALLIGINQYPTLQPLMYAQADAVGLRNFFVDEVGIPLDHCILLTDLSAAIEPYAHYPLRETIRSQLLDLCQTQVQPEDTLWVFFSGYGCHRAGQDYILPVDGDPNQDPGVPLEDTAISLPWLMETLKAAPTDNYLLVLDMSHSQGATGAHPLGQQTLALAKDFEIPTLLSCQPHQYSHETMAVRHGLFTQALLEGMRYHGCVTLKQLADYVVERVPELSQHHWRPEQNPVYAIPTAQKFMMVLPLEAIASLPLTERAEAAQLEGVPAPTPAQSRPDLGTSFTPEPLPLTPAPAAPLPAPRASVPEPAPSPPSPPADSPRKTMTLAGWGLLGTALVLLLGGLGIYQPWRQESPQADRPSGDLDTPSPGELGPEATPLDWAEAAVAQQRYGEARAWLNQVPPEQQGEETYQRLRQVTEGEAAQEVERNQALLAEARRLLQPLSASLLNDAIETARQIAPGSPFYDEAQADIDRWGRMILDLAAGRAATGDLTGAIAAAQLVPEDLPVHSQAQAQIQRWQLQQANRDQIQQAQATLQPGQASSFQQAIAEVQTTITPDQPGFALAQERIDQWSAEMLVIARARAAQGRWAEAIAAAQLIPPNTAAHAQAQEEIQRWQSQPPPAP